MLTALKTRLLLPLEQQEAHLTSILTSITAAKTQLCFHATLLRRHSQSFLFFLSEFKPLQKLKYWGKFNPYNRHHLRVLRAVFEDAIEEVERDEEMLGEYIRLGNMRDFGGFGKRVEVAELITRWKYGIKIRHIGRLILSSWTQETNALGKPEGSGSCAIRDVLQLMVAIWEEEVEKDYYRCLPEEALKLKAEDDDKKEGDFGTKKMVEEREFKGPTCLKRKDEFTLCYR